MEAVAGKVMIKNTPKLKKFYRRLIKKENIPYRKALLIYEMLYKEAVSLGALNQKNILDGLETDIKIAKALNLLR